MRSVLAVLLVAVAVVAPADAAGRCGGGTTVKSTDRYRVYAEDGLYLACLRSAGKPTELYDVDSNDSFGELRVAGRYVAVIAGSCSSSGCDYWLVLGDMRTGRSRMIQVAPSRLALRATGALAYSSAGAIELVRWSRPGDVRTLASGPEIDPRSLHRRGTRAVWREGGEMRSARLP